MLTLRLKDGSEVSERITHNRGGPDRPLSSEELAAKFRLNAGQRFSVEQVDAIESAIWSLDWAASITKVMELTH